MLEAITHANSTVDGYKWRLDLFQTLDFADSRLVADPSYSNGCLKYVVSSLPGHEDIGHRVRSRFKRAMPVKTAHGQWMWLVDGPAHVEADKGRWVGLET